MNPEVQIIKGKKKPALALNRSLSSEKQRVTAYCRVSTNMEEQLLSYKSQMMYYEDKIQSNPDWEFIGIYADEAITGTQVDKREDFKKMINDALVEKIDIIFCKNISRFSRNTLDTIKFVRKLKENNVSVRFEEENIDTTTMDGELMLTILSSVAQQEVQNISEHVKRGLKAKMQRGEMISFSGCLGYDYDKENRTLVINKEQTELVKEIFNMYLRGYGSKLICNELMKRGILTPSGKEKWAESTIMGILQNEKYIGTLIQGKSFTVDPISKRRVLNKGEEDQFCLPNHHEPIIDEETFYRVQEVIKKRKEVRVRSNGKRQVNYFSKKHSFSCMIECGFCGVTYFRRIYHYSDTKDKYFWDCMEKIKKGKVGCPDSKAISDDIVKKAFVEAYNFLFSQDEYAIEAFSIKCNLLVANEDYSNEINRVNCDIDAIKKKKRKVLDLFLNNEVEKDIYDESTKALDEEINEKNYDLSKLMKKQNEVEEKKKDFVGLKKLLENNNLLESFDRTVFDMTVGRIIYGGYKEDGTPDNNLLTFIFKSGFRLNDDVVPSDFDEIIKNIKNNQSDKFVVAHEFPLETDRVVFENHDGMIIRKKEKKIHVRVVFPI